MELLLVQATLENAGRKEISGPAMEELLQRLQDSAHIAQDLLDELDYFRIHDELHGTYNAADQHDKGGVHDLALNARHTAKAVGKLVSCCPWQHAKGRQRSPGESSSAQDTNQEVSGCMPKLIGKLLPCSSSRDPHISEKDCGSVQEMPKFEFNRVDFSRKMKGIIEKLQLVRKDVNGLLQSCDPRSVSNIAQGRPITKGRIDEPKLYGRDRVMDSIIKDITKGQYCDKGITVLPVVGSGGMGKTTLIQHIYRNQQVLNHFPVMIWICVSFSFNLDKVLEQIKTCTPAVEKEKIGSTTEDLIEQRLKSKRFLLVLDDIWRINNGDDWLKLLSTLNKSEEKGSMILVTTRFEAIAQMVETPCQSINLNGLESGEFRKLFLAFVFGDEQYPRDKQFLLETGDKIMKKLKGSPLAAKTVGRLLSKDLSLRHWRRVLKSRGWEKQTDDNEIMPALKLSYDFLPFHLQQCFAYSGLFPEDYNFRSDELISLWIALDILIPNGQDQTFEDIGLSNLNELVTHGFFREEKTMYGLRYVMHDLLHDLALKVASHDCLSLSLPGVGSVEIQPTTRHLSISTYGLGKYDAVSGKKLKSELEELKTRFKVEELQTLMLFGQMDECFVKIFGDFLGEANTLRVLHLPKMLCPVEFMLHNFSGLLHLRYLCLGTQEIQMHLPLGISKFYHLRILDLEKWHGSCDLPEGMSNLAKLCHFYVPNDQLHSDIYNVGKLKLLEELRVFQVNKRSEGFETKQLEHLTKLRELGIYNLEKIDTAEEATQAKLMEKNYLRRLTLDWDSKRSSVDPGVEAAVLESLQPHGDLQVLCIRGHGGPSCPTWLGDEFAVEALQSLYLDGVSWEVFPSLGKAWDLRELRFEHIARLKEFIVEKSFCMLTQLILIGLGSFEKWVYTGEQESSVGGDLLPPTAHVFPLLQVLVIRECPKLVGLPFSNHIVSPDWFPKLQELDVNDCPEFLPLIPISWIESLRSVTMECVKMLKEFAYSKSSNGAQLEIIGGADLHSIDQVLVFDKETSLGKLTLSRCPPLELKHLLMLTSLRTLIVENSVGVVGPLGGGQSDVEWQLHVECIKIDGLTGNTGEELTELLPHLPKLSKLEIWQCKNIKKLVVGVDVQQTAQEASEITAAAEEEDDGVLLFPAHLRDSLRELDFTFCPELVLVDPPTLVPGEGWLQALQSLQRLTIRRSPKFLSTFSFSCHIFPSSLQFLVLWDVEGMGTLEPLSNLSSLTILRLKDCGEDLKCQYQGQLNKLEVRGSPRFFADWDPNPRRALEDAEGGEEQQAQLVSSILRELKTNDVAGLLAAPVCRFLSSSLTKLSLWGHWCEGMERFSKEQEDALQLLSSLQVLKFWNLKDLQQLPAGLRNLTSLKILSVNCCPAISSLPNDALSDSLEKLDIFRCSEELKQQCRGLVGTIPKIKIDIID
ncbi:putative disease resistance protein RGA3 [Triticum dicoccoides]|uniref:putative disease resistance protein RGA3 n=1 Tax=Triticum dicoccoides TaxID=85692 RepID=UPI00188EA547|nr:putative disease resistance protein RGA3 [Triticum dicoccoides]XP_037475111.1 putative disease resistance protein RGA3 [Triticum dicoccoides]XP_037475112.1 putative disease resistance protein RGA3 [Triticum dicoccoides]XP_037475113.1 putative disease resistance protein RGA3 [Triticum dicoccoides]XP_037475114.1 putative disease resistance protein RGA3 [Triticum dicoccoides]XP_037475115.1 putative disease resistance protein RGA3 [Triticum dicoccoides]XP_037475116.1 putative disease resistanc